MILIVLFNTFLCAYFAFFLCVIRCYKFYRIEKMQER